MLEAATAPAKPEEPPRRKEIKTCSNTQTNVKITGQNSFVAAVCYFVNQVADINLFLDSDAVRMVDLKINFLRISIGFIQEIEFFRR